MYHSGIGDHFRGEYPVGIAFLYRIRQFVVNKNRRRNAVKFLLLVLPCGAEIPLQMAGMPSASDIRGQGAFAVGIDIDTFVLCLFHKQMQVAQVMADITIKGPFSMVSGTFTGTGCRRFPFLPCPEAPCISNDLSGFQNQGSRSDISAPSIPTARMPL
jgi:hypothetical protein